jgi:hypothetical protein
VARCVDFGTAAHPIEPLVRSAQPYASGLHPNGTRQRRSRGRRISPACGKALTPNHHFRAGDTVSGDALPVADPRLEMVEFYKIGNLKVRLRAVDDDPPPPPWHGVPPPLAVCRERGHRRLAPRTYQEKCASCMWGCRMPVERLLISGIRVSAATEPRRSATVLFLVLSKNPDRSARFPAVME